MKIACTILITIISLSVMSGCVTQKKSVTADGYAAGILPDLTTFLVFGDYASSLSDAFTIKYKYTQNTSIFDHNSKDVTETMFITVPATATNAVTNARIAREFLEIGRWMRGASNSVPDNASDLK